MYEILNAVFNTAFCFINAKFFWICFKYCVVDNCKLLTIFESVILNSNKPIKVVHILKKQEARKFRPFSKVRRVDWKINHKKGTRYICFKAQNHEKSDKIRGSREKQRCFWLFSKWTLWR